MASKLLGHFKYWLLALVGLLAVVLLAENSFSYLDPDFGRYYQLGSQTWQQFSLASLEHGWLTNLIAYGCSHFGGYLALSLLFIGLAWTIWFILIRQTVKNELSGQGSSLFFWLLTAIAFKASLPYFGVRSQVFTILFLLILSLWLAKVVRRQAWRNFDLVLLPVFFWLWAALQHGVMAGLIVLSGWSGYRLLLWIAGRFRQSGKVIQGTLPGRQIVISLIITGLSWLMAALFRRTDFSLTLNWQPLVNDLWSWQALYYFIFGAALVLLIIKLSYQSADNRRQIVKWWSSQDYWTILLAIAWFFLTWFTAYNFPLFVIVSFSWLASFYYQLVGGLTIETKWPIYLKLFVLSAVILSGGLAVANTNWLRQPDRDYCGNYPCAALQYLRQTPYRHWITLINYDWQGYFYWQWPDKAVIASEALQLQQESQIKKFINDSNLSVVVISQPQVPRFDWLEIWLLGRGQKIQDYDNFSENIRRVMLKMPDWRMIYSDNTAIIYVRQ
ncbi:MAG TPA: hypothetical protein PKN62_00635 [bacterium]|nr:hypothetical protein [bacterium]